MTSTHYETDVHKGSNVAQLAVAVADALGGVLPIAAPQTCPRCSAWCCLELV